MVGLDGDEEIVVFVPKRSVGGGGGGPDSGGAEAGGGARGPGSAGSGMALEIVGGSAWLGGSRPGELSSPSLHGEGPFAGGVAGVDMGGAAGRGADGEGAGVLQQQQRCELAALRAALDKVVDFTSHKESRGEFTRSLLKGGAAAGIVAELVLVSPSPSLARSRARPRSPHAPLTDVAAVSIVAKPRRSLWLALSLLLTHTHTQR
jgi:hypothetical protein